MMLFAFTAQAFEKQQYQDRNDYTIQNQKDIKKALIMLHGGRGSPERFKDKTIFHQVMSNDTLLVYLEGSETRKGSDRRSWMVSEFCCGLINRTPEDELNYIDGVAKEISEKHSIDIKEITLVGHSNGGMVVYNYMCDNREIPTGIVVAGTSFGNPRNCILENNETLFSIRSKFDKQVPYNNHRNLGLVEFKAERDILQGITFNNCKDVDIDFSKDILQRDFKCGNGRIKHRFYNKYGHKWEYDYTFEIKKFLEGSN